MTVFELNLGDWIVFVIGVLVSIILIFLLIRRVWKKLVMPLYRRLLDKMLTRKLLGKHGVVDKWEVLEALPNYFHERSVLEFCDRFAFDDWDNVNFYLGRDGVPFCFDNVVFLGLIYNYLKNHPPQRFPKITENDVWKSKYLFVPSDLVEAYDKFVIGLAMGFSYSEEYRIRGLDNLWDWALEYLADGDQVRFFRIIYNVKLEYGKFSLHTQALDEKINSFCPPIELAASYQEFFKSRKILNQDCNS